MKRDHHSSGDIEKDPVWDLLRESRGVRPRPDFAADVARAARLEGQAKPWWSRLWVPAAAGTALAGAAALVAVVLTLQSDSGHGNGPVAMPAAPDTTLAELQDDFETEVFLEASENLARFDDAELVSLIGF